MKNGFAGVSMHSGVEASVSDDTRGLTCGRQVPGLPCVFTSSSIAFC